MESILDLPWLRYSIARHEGRRKRAYHDSEGVLTVGVGHNHVVDSAEQDLDRRRDRPDAR